MRSNTYIKTFKTKEEEYQALADCIRSEQLSAQQVVSEFNSDPVFYEWYKSKYLNGESNE